MVMPSGSPASERGLGRTFSGGRDAPHRPHHSLQTSLAAGESLFVFKG